MFGQRLLSLSTLGMTLLSVTALVMPQAAFAQSIPPSSSPGAVMWSAEQQFYLQRNTPYLFRPIMPSDVSIPEAQEPVLNFEEGVLPKQKGIQGILVTPGGHVYIGPPTQ
jgi:hypothetical protein